MIKKILLLALVVCISNVADSQEKVKKASPLVVTESTSRRTEAPKKKMNNAPRKAVVKPAQLKAFKVTTNIEPVKD